MVRKCEFDVKHCSEKLGEIKNLTALDLNGCTWADDSCVKAAIFLNKKLQLLNVGNTSISHHSANFISQIYKLKTLDVGNTNITQKNIE